MPQSFYYKLDVAPLMSIESEIWKAINVQLAGRVYQITVLETQEDGIRAIAKDINERVAQFQLQYVNQKDKQDYLAMAILAWSLESLSARNNNMPAALQGGVSAAQMEALHALLDQALGR